MRVMCLAVGGAVMLAALASGRPAAAQSLGCLALPSTVPQFFGYGYGAGHHVPIVRTPRQQPPRMQRRAMAPACYGPLCPQPYMPAGCYGPACDCPACHDSALGPPCEAAMPPQRPIGIAPQPRMAPMPVASLPMRPAHW
jgi:hypothetical protein